MVERFVAKKKKKHTTERKRDVKNVSLHLICSVFSH